MNAISWRRGAVGIALPVLVLVALSCGDHSETPEAADFRARAAPGSDAEVQACRDRDPLRRALFGDLHVHTALSSDAWNYDLEVRPSDAYAYAFGGPILLPPKNAAGEGTRRVRIGRPLDFAAVTDHAEFIGETKLCADPSSEVYGSETCLEVRASTTPLDNPFVFVSMNPWPIRENDVCGEDGERCRDALRSAWQETIRAAQAWDDSSAACERTTFIGYEYSSLRLGSNLHRNVIFRNEIVPRRPFSYLDAQREWQLWEHLRDDCIESGSGCDAIAIPHNSNISNGRMFAVDYPEAADFEAQVARARLRARVEPLVEVMQHKGDSECRVEMEGILGAPDEACGFEKFSDVRYRDDEGRAGAPGACWDWMADSLPHLGPGACMNHRNYVRYVLTEGLREWERLGVNPTKFGIMASTDTHNGMAGGVDERTFPGHVGIIDDDPLQRVSEEPGMGNVSNNPGGLVGVWAEENSRDAIFDAMQRREVFGTSGPRIRPRFFGGFELPEDLCDRPDAVARADARGVPMGGDLATSSAGASPAFWVSALADVGTVEQPGSDLQRIQIVKGWVDEGGQLHQRVVDVAGGDNGASVDPLTCEPQGEGARSLCGVWRDPDFDASRPAVYYARVLENPSCRHSAWACLEWPASERPPGCEHRAMERFVKERAWTSPIWFTPERTGLD